MRLRKPDKSKLPSSVGRALVLATAIFATSVSMPTLAAGSNGCCDISYCGPPRIQDQVWSISSRCVGCPSRVGPNESGLRYSVYSPQDGWVRADADAFAQMNGQFAVTGFYVHGYRNDSATAERMGWAAYHAIVKRGERSGTAVAPIRWIIWSWPSDQSGPILRDAREKAQRTDVDGYYLAAVISRLDQRDKVSVMGWSLGARIATGATHLLGGGSLGGLSLDDAASSAKRPVRAVLMAATMHDYWLEPGAYHGRAISQVDRMLLLNNGCDPVLRRYWRVSRCERPDALGRTGLSRPSALGQAAGRIEQIDVASSIGRQHDSTNYLCSEALMQKARRYVLWVEQPRR